MTESSINHVTEYLPLTVAFEQGAEQPDGLRRAGGISDDELGLTMDGEGLVASRLAAKLHRDQLVMMAAMLGERHRKPGSAGQAEASPGVLDREPGHRPAGGQFRPDNLSELVLVHGQIEQRICVACGHAIQNGPSGQFGGAEGLREWRPRLEPARCERESGEREEPSHPGQTQTSIACSEATGV